MGQPAASAWNQRRAAIASWSTWCTHNGYPAPDLPAAVERQPEPHDATRAIDRDRRPAPPRSSPSTSPSWNWTPAAPAWSPRAGTSSTSTGHPVPRTCCPGSCTDTSPGWDLHQLRHSAATHLGDANAGLQLIMANGRWRNTRTAMPYVKPGAAVLAEVTELLDTAPPRRS